MVSFYIRRLQAMCDIEWLYNLQPSSPARRVILSRNFLGAVICLRLVLNWLDFGAEIFAVQFGSFFITLI